MRVFKYSVSKKFNHGVMEGRVIHGYATGYVFAEDTEEAIRRLEAKYPSDRNTNYSFGYEETSIIEL